MHWRGDRSGEAVGGDASDTRLAFEHGEARGWYLGPLHTFRSDRAAEPELSDAALRTLASPETPLTYTCVPPGTGVRTAVDRDEDGVLDRDEIDRCGDPADPARLPRLAHACVGDCDRDCTVRIGELVRGVRVALPEAPLAACVASDGDRDGTVAIGELIAGVANSLNGC